MPNRLAQESSPYLLQHADNPVDWWPWCEEAFEEARARDVPVFLSVGYSSCHWCHVMERESFEDAVTAAQLNSDFVCIKVDREERPDIDAVYMEAVQAMTGQGGWPMSVFTDGDGRPFFGGTYFPPDDSSGHASFRTILTTITDVWREQRSETMAQAGRLVEALRELSLPERSSIDADLPARTLDSMWSVFDRRNGGFGRAPKFPQPMNLAFALAFGHRTGDERAVSIVETTLTHMGLGGIFDQLAGGFARYSVDATWTVPHFEKMLYDNAQLARVYLWAGAALGSDFYRRIAGETVDFLIREMRDPAGGFLSAIDADSEGAEGLYYVWTPSQVSEVAGADAEIAIEHFGVTERGNFDGANVLTADQPLEALDGQGRAAVERARAAMLSARSERVAPSIDDKVIAAWNGLALRALGEAARVLDRTDYLEAAVACGKFLATELTVDGRLMRSWRSGRVGVGAFADDHAQVGLGYVSLFEATGDWSWIDRGREMAVALMERFIDPADGLPRTSANDDLVARTKDVFDSAEPGAASSTAELLTSLGVILDDRPMLDAARRIVETLAAVAERAPTGFGNLMCVVERLLSDPPEIVIAGSGADADDMRRLVRRSYLPGATVVTGTDGAPEGLPLLEGRTQTDEPVGYVCRGFRCDFPVHDAASLADILSVDSDKTASTT